MSFLSKANRVILNCRDLLFFSRYKSLADLVIVENGSPQSLLGVGLPATLQLPTSVDYLPLVWVSTSGEEVTHGQCNGIVYHLGNLIYFVHVIV